MQEEMELKDLKSTQVSGFSNWGRWCIKNMEMVRDTSLWNRRYIQFWSSIEA